MAKVIIKGTRGNDTITVGDTGVTTNGTFKGYTANQIDTGFAISGNAGNDVITGGRGADEINGGAGSDRLIGGGGYDKLLGGDGADTLIDSPLGATFAGGRGIDTVDFSGAAAGVFVDIGPSVVDDDITLTVLSDGRLSVGGWGDWVEGTITGVENITGSNFDDQLWGDQNANRLTGGGGTDELSGQGGNDQLFGGTGNDYLSGNAGNDQLTGGAGRDMFLFACGSAAGLGDGYDTILDYTPGEDVLVFQWAQNDLSWSTTTVNGQQSLLGTYDDGRSQVVLVGITDPAEVSVILSDYNWTFGIA